MPSRTTVAAALATGAIVLAVGIVAVNDTDPVTGTATPTTPSLSSTPPLEPAYTPPVKTTPPRTTKAPPPTVKPRPTTSPRKSTPPRTLKPTTTPPRPTTAKPSPAPALSALVTRLRVADEGGPDYDRSEFGSRAPTSSTRERLLAGEQRADGSWYSKWDGRVWRDPSRVDADHTVALAEAWSSGAHAWSKSKRVRFANDLTSPFSLNLITDTLNQQVKSDKDPFDWMPDVNRCQYVREWTSVKLAWGLTADAEEKMALHFAAEECES